MPPSPVDFTRAGVGSASWWLGRLSARLTARQPAMTLYDDYYHGRHRETYKPRQVLAAFGLKQPLWLNYCAVVVDSLDERLGIEGFRFGDDDKGSEAAWAIWQANTLDSHFKRGQRSGLVKGEFSLMVWPDANGEPRIYVEDGSEVIVAVDPADSTRRLAALKRWYDRDQRQTFGTVYLPDGIYKYQLPPGQEPPASRGSLPEGFMRRGGAGTTIPSAQLEQLGAWERRFVDGEDWPLRNPLGAVPVVPIPNKPNLAAQGESEIALVVPIQDAINANVANVMLAGLYGAFRQKWATNVVLENDPNTGKPKAPWDVSVDSLITSPPARAGEQPTEFGEFGQSDLDGYVKLHELYVQAIATATRLPPHYLLGTQGTFPSGEALTAVELGLSEKAKERMVDNADPVEDAMRLALRLKAAQPGLSKADQRRYLGWAAMQDAEVLARDPQTRTESAHVDALVKLLSLKVPTEALWAKIPASPQEIRKWKALNETSPPVTPPPDGDTDPASAPAPTGP